MIRLTRSAGMGILVVQCAPGRFETDSGWRLADPCAVVYAGVA